jgi:glycopeptide antibiotics resistance protein
MSGAYVDKILKITALMYLIALFYITLGTGERYVGIFDEGNINLVPFSGKWFYFKHFSTLYDNEKVFIVREILGNLVLFAPFSWALYTLLRKNFKTITVTAIIVLLVLFIESTQYVLHIGTFDVDDLILNISGGIIGIFLFKVFKKRFV